MNVGVMGTVGQAANKMRKGSATGKQKDALPPVGRPASGGPRRPGSGSMRR